MAAFTDANVLAVLKECYMEKDVHNTLFRNSPTLAKIGKFRASGKYYVVPMLYSRGGGVTGDFSGINSLVASRAKNTAAKVDYGQAFSGFAISPKEVNASDMDQGSFVSLVKEFFFASNEALRKTVGAAIFGSGFGEVAIVTAVDAGRLIFTIKAWGAMGLDIGSSVVFATGTQPNGALRSATPNEVSAINDNGDGTVTVTVSAQYPATVAANDWVCISGFRSGSSPLCFTGLRGWLPTVANRTGATWTSYIGTAFFGVDRSAYPSRLAGEFILRDTVSNPNEKRSDAIIRGIRAVRRNGGKPDMIVVNDYDYAEIIKEIDAYKQYFQSINGPAKGDKVELVRGVSSMMYAFSSTWVEYVVDDPYCPEGYAYVLESESLGMAMLSNPKVIEENIPATNEGGTPKIASQAEPPQMYAFNIEDYVATAPYDGTDGQGTRVTTQLFAAFFIRNPAHCAVVKFDSTLP
jgi:hypothetical protein